MSHLSDFAHHLIAAHGPMSIQHVYGAFSQTGTAIEGITPEDKQASIKAALASDDRLTIDDETGLVSHKENDQQSANQDEETEPATPVDEQPEPESRLVADSEADETEDHQS